MRLGAGIFFLALALFPQAVFAAQPDGPDGTIASVDGTVEFRRAGAADWETAYRNAPLAAGDAVRTGERSRATLVWRGGAVVRLDELTWIETPGWTGGRVLRVLRGILYFFHRGRTVDAEVSSDAAIAVVQGTEFVFAALPDGGAEVSMFDGRVVLSNAVASVTLTNGQVAKATAGGAPQRTAVLAAGDFTPVQWSLYYPGVLVFSDLQLPETSAALTKDSVRLYERGALPAALAAYPRDRQPATAEERVFLAALLLANGHAPEATAQLDAVPQAGITGRLADALRLVIATVVRGEAPEAGALAARPDALATELLAASYALQSQARLDEARAAARRAVELAPDSGIALARLAELEFSFGRIREARGLVTRSLEQSPDNAEAVALRGFLAAADNRLRQAADWFARALKLDGALGNAWLGRGLVRIRRGDLEGGTGDLMIAAATEPQRAVLRSYLGKAFTDDREMELAGREFEIAERLDPGDPTRPLYSALLRERQNRINEAIVELEESMRRNDHRGVFRSSLLLDQDSAVRSANLARIYADAGLEDVAFREAVRAVQKDYANFSAHLFLANSYDRLRDPRLFDLRHETAANSEYLVANLLAPVNAGVLSSAVSQGEYSRLFDRDGVGVVSTTEYLSRGEWLQTGAQFGAFGNFAYSVEASYGSTPGQRSNSDQELLQLNATLRQQLSPADTVFLQAGFLDRSGGDTASRYDWDAGSPSFRFDEEQLPLLVAGYRHDWDPEHTTLVLAGRLSDRLEFSDDTFPSSLTFVSLDDPALPGETTGEFFRTAYRGELEIYTMEPQHLWRQGDRHQTILGLRGQFGDFQTESRQSDPVIQPPFFPDPGFPSAQSDLALNYQRLGAYAYHTWEVVESTLWLEGGLAYDHLRRPANLVYPPLMDETTTDEAWQPKAGFRWQMTPVTSLRAAFTRSLTGVSLEQSYRLEPAQVAGFTQAYRSTIPESAAGGPVPGTLYDIFSVGLEHRFPSRTYLGLAAEWITSDAERTVGGFYLDPSAMSHAEPTSLHQDLSHEERLLVVTLNQLLGRQWSVGVRYRLTDSELSVDTLHLDDPFRTLEPARRSDTSATLHQVLLDTTWNHPSGLFARANALWTTQSNVGYEPDIPGDDFWQINLLAGHRFLDRRLEVALGILNLTDQDYNLNPLTPTADLPRERTFFVRLRLSF